MSATTQHSIPLGAASEGISLRSATQEISASGPRCFVPTKAPTQPVHILASTKVIHPGVPA
jgi:hypothetical protein